MHRADRSGRRQLPVACLRSRKISTLGRAAGDGSPRPSPASSPIRRAPTGAFPKHPRALQPRRPPARGRSRSPPRLGKGHNVEHRLHTQESDPDPRRPQSR